jgi:uncharacterized hydantoinase/oxoprolinase family protein
MRTLLGWDIGGVNTKAALVVDGRVVAAEGRPFELQHAPASLAAVLQDLAATLVASVPPSLGGAPLAHAVTMTAELSQMFRSKREGVAFVLDAVAQAFPVADVAVYTVDGRFLSPEVARAQPLAVAAANWTATAGWWRGNIDSILVDTQHTTDIIPSSVAVSSAEDGTTPTMASGTYWARCGRNRSHGQPRGSRAADTACRPGFACRAMRVAWRPRATRLLRAHQMAAADRQFGSACGA